MAWIEIPALRGKGSRVYRDDANPLKGVVLAQAGTAWHFKSDPDGGYWDQEVDLRPERILAGGHDGWRVTANSWHYFLGQPNGLPDGFVGFGGRQGDKWLLFRLLRTGYLHWPTRAWDDIGGAPDYDRANLSREDHSTVNTVGEEIHVETVATWSDIWNTPSGGALDVSWRADGNRLKEEITINQEARDWIATNRPPSTPASETYFGFVFRLGSAPDVDNIEMDLSYLPRWLKNNVLQNTDDFDDDDGTAGIEVQNALEQFLFFLPIDYAYVDLGDGDRAEIKLRKRIWRDGSDYYLLVGALATDLAGLPAGDLVFDPTVDYQVGASGDDAGEASTGTVSAGPATFLVDDSAEYAGYRWTGVTIPSGATIDSDTYIDLRYDSAYTDEPYVDVYFEDGSAPSGFVNGTGSYDISTRTKTSASITYGDGSDEGATSDDWLSNTTLGVMYVQTIIAELQASYDYSGGSAMLMLYNQNASGGPPDDFSIRHYDNAAGDAAKLHIEYTEEAGGEDFTVSIMMYHQVYSRG